MQTKHKNLGFEALRAGRLDEAYYIFEQEKFLLGQAYCKFLSEDFDAAKVLLNIIKNSSPVVNWLLCLISVIEGRPVIQPSFLQIKNFYEQDLEMLFLYNKKSYIQKVLNKITFFEKYNKEIYKYTGRVLKNNNQQELAEKYLRKSLDIYYKDPETHYLLGEIYEAQNKTDIAIKEYKKSNASTGEYLPAKIKLKNLIR